MVEMKNEGILICLFCLGLTAVFGQNTYSVSDIEVKSNGPEVILTWRDNDDIAKERYKILRHYTAITQSNYTKATVLKEVEPGVETFTDTPPGGRKWWYAVMTVSTSGVHDIFQEWRNYFPLPISVESASDFRNDIARLLEFNVKQRDSEILLEYTADKDGREIVIFRSLKFIDSPEVLDYAASIDRVTGRTGKRTDKPVSGVPFYYAAVDAELFDTAYPQMLDFAAFSPPITASYDDDRIVSTFRPTPLPGIRLSGKLQDGSFLPEITGEAPPRIPLSAEAEQIIKSILSPIQAEPPKVMKPDILPVDHGHSQNRRQQALRAIILTGSFAQGDWERAESELFALSASNGIGKEMKSRILYYQGQSLYFLKRFREAFTSFAVSSGNYYTESRKWILAIYENLEPNSLK